MSDFYISKWRTGKLNALVKRIGDEDARRMLSDKFEVRFAEPPLLSFVRTIAPPTTAKPTIVQTSKQYKSCFDGVDEGACTSELTLHKLERNSLDAPIISALGDEEQAEVILADFNVALAEKEAAGDFTWLIAYVRDKGEVLRAVDARWVGDGWSIYAYSVGLPDEWDGGQVLSRPPAGETGN